MEKFNEFFLIPVRPENLEKAIQIAREIFPYENSNDGEFLPEKEYKMSLKDFKKFFNLFLVEYENQIIGITGFYRNYRRLRQTKELWL
ncbi:hypothetical protein K8Q94_03100 [Candidatus Nomurabacteria bacterium]|nr:hypothetical protein [Candidatus Nomurabacteria bacterium]